jgi:hypothetical protein
MPEELLERIDQFADDHGYTVGHKYVNTLVGV